MLLEAVGKIGHGSIDQATRGMRNSSQLWGSFCTLGQLRNRARAAAKAMVDDPLYGGALKDALRAQMETEG